MSGSYGHAVIDGRLQYVSVTQIEAFEPCAVKGCRSQIQVRKNDKRSIVLSVRISTTNYCQNRLEFFVVPDFRLSLRVPQVCFWAVSVVTKVGS